MMRFAPLILAAYTLLTIAGCTVDNTRIVVPGIRAVNNVKYGGNVFVHICNQEAPNFASIRFEIRNEGEKYGGDWEGSGEFEYDPHGYTTFMFRIQPGKYELVLNDGITSEPWIFPFTVADKPIHLDVNYWLGEDWNWKPETNHSPRVYHSHFDCDVTNSEPIVF
ncbi:MAG: hypothetical protein R3C45_00220 [Phycisphaerales bacterium]